MAAGPHSSSRLAFGAFAVDIATGELTKGGSKIRLPPQPFEILVSLLARPGEVVTREELRQRIWSDGTFVDFERGLNSAMVKLRRALGESADAARYIETIPGRGYRFIGVVDPTRDGPNKDLSARRGKAALWAVVVAACLAAAAVVGWLYRTRDPQSPWSLTRVTASNGLAEHPALSRDGSFVAYSQLDRQGRRDLFVKYLSGGQPIRVTFDGLDNRNPDFSPDGSRLVFRSARDGGGVYLMPALGGDVRLIARGGRDPKFSPDGRHVAYWTGAESLAAAIPGTGEVWVAPVAGGDPCRVGTKLTASRHPIWSRDGRRLLVVGYSSPKLFDPSAIDWWMLGADNDEAIQIGARSAMLEAGMKAHPGRTPVPSVPSPHCWIDGNSVFYSLSIGDSENIWRLRVSQATGRVEGMPERLTTGSGRETGPACSSNGALAFASIEIKSGIWTIPFDLNSGSPKGGLELIGDPGPWREGVSLGRDGRVAAFAAYKSGWQQIWMRDLTTGGEQTVAESPFAQRFPVVNASGSRIAFSVYEGDKRNVYVASPGGAPEKVCEGCLRATEWSADGMKLLVFGGSPYRIDLLDVASRNRTPLITHSTWPVLYGRFSPDNRLVSFTVRIRPDRGRISVAPVDGSTLIPESAWVTVADADVDDYANWSPDGRTLYYSSGLGGREGIWGSVSIRVRFTQSATPLLCIVSKELCPSSTVDGRRRLTASRFPSSKDGAMFG